MKRVFLLTVFFSLFLVGPAFSQPDQEGPDDADYSYGEVVQVTDHDLSVLEYDYENDEEHTVNYTVTASTVLTNIAHLNQLAQGDTVEVFFKDADGKKVAQTIIKDDTGNPLDDETPAPSGAP